jgi:hypothetical protein
MITRYNNISLGLGAPGLALWIIGAVMLRTYGPTALGICIGIAGVGLLCSGLTFYAKAKGQEPVFGLLGLLGLIGLIVLACLKDNAPDGSIKKRKKKRQRKYRDEEDDDYDRPRKKARPLVFDDEEDEEEKRPRKRKRQDDED